MNWGFLQTPWRWALVSVAAAIIAGAIVIAFPAHQTINLARLDPTDPALTLEDVERTVSDLFSGPELTPAHFAEKKLRSEAVIFDIRSRDEYERSHIQGAVHLPPDTTAEEFQAKHGAKVAGKKVVLYCAVGVRSAIMQQRLQTSLASFGAEAAYNLRGGLFRWFIEGRTVVRNSSPAGEIHPYDQSWAALLERSLPSQS